MSNTFMKKGLRGFTLIELLVVIAIIGLLSTIIAAPIQNARKKAKDVKKVAELRETQSALEQYAEANGGQYPTTLAALSPQYMPVLPSYAGTNVPPRDRFAYAYYTGTPSGTGSTPTNFAYHLAVHLDVNNTVLDNGRHCNGGVKGTTLTGTVTYPSPCVSFNSTADPTVSYTNYVGGMICGNGAMPATTGTTPTDGTCSASTDFGIISLGATTTCTNVNDCVYDVSNNQ